MPHAPTNEGMDDATQTGTLILIATPIGNLEDLTHRAERVLREVDALACEDTRRTRTLLQHYDIPKPRTLLSYHEHNEKIAGKRILHLLNDGLTVGLVSDGGYPGISDPGYRIVNAAIDAGHSIEVLPGPSAPPMALLMSGLPPSSYTFMGFPPRKSGARQRFLEAEAEKLHTLILFESPHRVEALLRDALAVLGNRKAAICFEMTKKFERVHRGLLSALLEEIETAPKKGEVTVVIAGMNRKLRKKSPKPAPYKIGN